MAVVTTSITVDFSSSNPNSILKAEVDSRADGFNNGVTTFVAGDSPVILLIKSSDVTVDQVVFSEGGYASKGSGTIEVEEWLTYAMVKEGNLANPPSGPITIEAHTGSANSFTLSDFTKVMSDVAFVGAVKVKYSYAYDAYQLVGASGTAPVVIYIKGHA